MATDKIGRRRLLGMAEVNGHCLLDMAVFLTCSLSSAICRCPRPRVSQLHSKLNEVLLVSSLQRLTI